MELVSRLRTSILKKIFFCLRLEKAKLWIPPVMILIIAFFFLPIQGTYTSSDSSFYISTALNITQGKGYVDTDGSPLIVRGPVFPFLIAIAFKLLGTSVESAFWVVRLLYILSSLMLYFLGKKLFDQEVGIATALLFLTAYSINSISMSNPLPDNTQAFLVVLFILLATLSLERKSYILYALAGIIFTLGYLTKETTICFYPLPLLATIFIKDYRCQRNFFGFLVFSLFALFALSPWIIWAYKASGELVYALGGSFYAGTIRAAKSFSSEETGKATFVLFSLIKNYFKGLANYYQFSLQPLFLLAPFYLLSWFFVPLRALKKEKSHIILALSFLLFSPVIVFISAKGTDPRHGMIVFYLSVLATASFTSFLADSSVNKALKIKEKGDEQKRALIQILKTMTMVFLTLIVISVQTGLWQKEGTTYWGYIKETSYVLYRLHREKQLRKGSETKNAPRLNNWEATGWHNKTTREIGEWLTQNIPKGSTIMCDEQLSRAIYFYANGSYPFFLIPYVSSMRESPWGKQELIPKSKKVLFLWPYFLGRNYPLRALIEENLLNEITKKSISYVILTGCHNFISLYFRNNPSFTLIKDFENGTIKLYQINKIKPSPKFRTSIGHLTDDYLRKLQKEDPQELKRIEQEFFKEKLGWGEEEIKKIMEEKYPLIKPYKIY